MKARIHLRVAVSTGFAFAFREWRVLQIDADAGHVSFVQPAAAARAINCEVILLYQKAAPAPMEEREKKVLHCNSSQARQESDGTARVPTFTRCGRVSCRPTGRATRYAMPSWQERGGRPMMLREGDHSFKQAPKFPVFDLAARGPRCMSLIAMANAGILAHPALTRMGWAFRDLSKSKGWLSYSSQQV